MTPIAQRTLLAAAFAFVGCGDPKPTAPPGPPRLVSDAEIDGYSADTTRRLADNASRRCDRPVLRGAALPGPAVADAAAFDRPTGNLATCIASLDELGKTDPLEARTPALLDFERRCGIEFEGAIRKATAHRDACSAFQVGRPQPAAPLTWIRIAKVVGLRARLRADSHDVVGALWSLWDAARMYQDLSRGHATLLTSMIGTAATDIVVEHARAIVEAAPALPAGALDELTAALDRLLATEPGFTDVLAGDVDQMAVIAIAPLRPDDAMIRRAAPATKPGKPDQPPIATTSFGDPRDDQAIGLVVIATLRASLATACPTDATFRACSQGLAQLARDGEARAKGNTDLAKLYRTLVARAYEPTAEAAEAARLSIRGTIVDVLASVAPPAFENFAEKRAGAYARLAALRLQLEVARAKRCPTTGELDTAPYAALRSPRLLGEPLVVTSANAGLGIAPPRWMKRTKLAWQIRCPK